MTESTIFGHETTVLCSVVLLYILSFLAASVVVYLVELMLSIRQIWSCRFTRFLCVCVHQRRMTMTTCPTVANIRTHSAFTLWTKLHFLFKIYYWHSFVLSIPFLIQFFYPVIVHQVRGCRVDHALIPHILLGIRDKDHTHTHTHTEEKKRVPDRQQITRPTWKNLFLFLFWCLCCPYCSTTIFCALFFLACRS